MKYSSTCATNPQIQAPVHLLKQCPPLLQLLPLPLLYLPPPTHLHPRSLLIHPLCHHLQDYHQLTLHHTIRYVAMCMKLLDRVLFSLNADAASSARIWK